MSKEIQSLNAKDFEIINTLGKGANGIVYLVKNKNNDKLYTAKQSLKEFKKDDQQSSFNKEIRSCSKVQSPAILRIVGYSFEEFNNINSPTIFTEYMPNISLDVYLKKNLDGSKMLTSSQKYMILLGISIGMKVLHRNGIIHRDLKPGNVLLDNHFYPHIGDFGISIISDLELSQIIMSTVVGTPLYEAPEILSEEGSYNYKVDIYSFSLILYEMITRIKPFSEYKSVLKLMNDVIKEKRPNLEVIKDKSMRDFIQSCWSHNPTIRPTFDEIVNELLTDKYKKFFNVKESKVESYLSLFDEDLLLNISMRRIVTDIKNKAINGDSNAMLKLAIMYDQGEPGIDINKKEAIRYYQMACENDNSDAMNIYCHKLLKGDDGIPINKKEASQIYKRFADKGNIKAMNNYGIMLLLGDGIQCDKTKASIYLKKSADLGNPKAMLIYGNMLMNGDGIEMNKNEAAFYYKKSTEEGNETALMNYTNMLITGNGIRQNKKKAAKYLQLFASKGNSKIMLLYGIMLLIGDGIPINKRKASYLFKMAADQGEVEAMYNYGVMLYNGDGINEDKKEAKKYIEMAINLNYPKAKTFYEQNKMEVKEKTIDLSKYSLKFNRLTSNLYVDVFTHYKIKRDHSTCSSRFLLHDGFFKQDQYVNKNLSLRLGKIPGVYEICWIDSGFNAFNKMKSKYPKVYSEFLPITFITSDCVKLKNEMEKKELKNMSFILKRRRPSKISFVELKQLESNDNKTKIIIQQFISPYLIDGRKFDLRFYFIITNLKPLTVYQYKEGIAYFCKEQFNYTNSCFLYKKEIKKI